MKDDNKPITKSKKNKELQVSQKAESAPALTGRVVNLRDSIRECLVSLNLTITDDDTEQDYIAFDYQQLHLVVAFDKDPNWFEVIAPGVANPREFNAFDMLYASHKISSTFKFTKLRILNFRIDLTVNCMIYDFQNAEPYMKMCLDSIMDACYELEGIWQEIDEIKTKKQKEHEYIQDYGSYLDSTIGGTPDAEC